VGLEPSYAKFRFGAKDLTEANAFVIPGGKVFVYTGILPIAKNDDGLAAILGHEISHNLAQHAAENMSRYVLLEPIRWVFLWLDYAGYTGGLGRFVGDLLMDLGMMRPASRRQESEADYIGLLMMAKSCYNPDEAVKVWERMEKFQKAAGNSIPQWLSTHPSVGIHYSNDDLRTDFDKDSTRIEAMTKWLPKAEEARSESECAVTLGYSKEFQAATGGPDVWSALFR
jgi:metalloendopeptidase OMA1, mitochondrial